MRDLLVRGGVHCYLSELRDCRDDAGARFARGKDVADGAGGCNKRRSSGHTGEGLARERRGRGGAYDRLHAGLHDNLQRLRRRRPGKRVVPASWRCDPGQRIRRHVPAPLPVVEEACGVLRLSPRSIAITRVVDHMLLAYSLRLVDVRSLRSLVERFPLCPEPFAQLRIVHPRVLLCQLFPSLLGPHHEGVHGSLYVVGRSRHYRHCSHQARSSLKSTCVQRQLESDLQVAREEIKSISGLLLASFMQEYRAWLHLHTSTKQNRTCLLGTEAVGTVD